jgi:hypothetical protein
MERLSSKRTQLSDVWISLQGLCFAFEETNTFTLEDLSHQEIKKIIEENLE